MDPCELLLAGQESEERTGIVDLDGGGTVKGNIVADADDLRFDMPVRLVFETLERADAKGRSYLSYHFVKA